MHLKRFAALAATLLAPNMAAAGDLRADANAVFKPIDAASVAAVVKNNELTPAKIELGGKLFFDPRLSKSQIISCNSCHNLGTGGADAGPTSIGHGWAEGAAPRADRAQRRIQCRAVLGRARRRP